MSEFSILKPAINTKDTGQTYPQVGIISTYNRHSTDSIANLKSMQRPKFNPDFSSLFLDEKANATDLLSHGLSTYGLLVSDDLLETLNQFSINNHSTFKVSIENNASNKNFHWIHFEENNILSLIDYSQSLFHVVEFGFRKNDISLNSIDDYYQRRDELLPNAIIKAHQIILREVPPLDFFIIPFIDGKYYISPSLSKELTSSALTGIDILPTSSPKVSFVV